MGLRLRRRGVVRRLPAPLLVFILTFALTVALILAFTRGLTFAYTAATLSGQPTPHPPTFADLQPSSVALLSAEEGWVVGGLGVNVPPAQLLHLQAGHWSRVSLDDSADGLQKVVMRAPDDGWAVGGNEVFHYDGTSWRLAFTAPRTTNNSLDLQDVAFSSPTEGWAVGLDGVLRYHQGVWADVTSDLPPDPAAATLPQGLLPPPYPSLRALALVSAADVWAVGTAGVLWHYDGRTWRLIPHPRLAPGLANLQVALYAVALASPSEGWAVGGGDPRTGSCPGAAPGVVERFAGGQWTIATRLSGQPTLRALALVSPSEAWAAGALVYRQAGQGEAPNSNCIATSYVAHEVDGQWTPVPVPDVGTINGLAFDAPDDGWAAADEGLLHYHAGTWTAVLK